MGPFTPHKYFLVKMNHLGPMVSGTCTTYATHVTTHTWKNHLDLMVSGAIHTNQNVLI